MSKLRQMLLLLHRGALSTHQIGTAIGISELTVRRIASSRQYRQRELGASPETVRR